ncbi:MAG: hypothetical protein ACREDO_11175 [Methyloceanibacter sp.]
MSTPRAFSPRLSLTALLVGLAVLFANAPDAGAQSRRNDSSGAQDSGRAGKRNYGVGGTSLTLSDVWGPAKMPPAPHDFGPHFDYPPEPLNSAPLHDPYPN